MFVGNAIAGFICTQNKREKKDFIYLKIMVNTRRKGYRNQKKTQDLLEEEGWAVYTAPVMKFRHNNDIFHLFDHVASKGEKIRFIQTKSNRCPKKVREDIKAFPFPKNVTKEVWIWKDYAREPEILIL